MAEPNIKRGEVQAADGSTIVWQTTNGVLTGASGVVRSLPGPGAVDRQLLVTDPNLAFLYVQAGALFGDDYHWWLQNTIYANLKTLTVECSYLTASHAWSIRTDYSARNGTAVCTSGMNGGPATQRQIRVDPNTYNPLEYVDRQLFSTAEPLMAEVGDRLAWFQPVFDLFYPSATRRPPPKGGQQPPPNLGPVRPPPKGGGGPHPVGPMAARKPGAGIGGQGPALPENVIGDWWNGLSPSTKKGILVGLIGGVAAIGTLGWGALAVAAAGDSSYLLAAGYTGLTGIVGGLGDFNEYLIGQMPDDEFLDAPAPGTNDNPGVPDGSQDTGGDGADYTVTGDKVLPEDQDEGE